MLLVKRFDRAGRRRFPYSSAAVVMGYPPGTYRPDGASYAELAIMARRAGRFPEWLDHHGVSAADRATVLRRVHHV